MNTVYSVIAIAGLVLLIAALVYLRYAQDENRDDITLMQWLRKKPFRFQIGPWIEKNYPGKGKWVFYLLAGSFIFMAVTGFLFSLFGFIRLQGIPLAMHAAAGGLFAAAVAAVAFFRTRDYHPDDINEKAWRSSRKSRRAIAYWIFLLAAFLLMATALLMMMPFVHFSFIRTAFFVHRWSALAAAGTALIWTEAALFSEEKSHD